MALYEYGVNDLPAEKGYIRQLADRTDDLDKLSEQLFAISVVVLAEAVGLPRGIILSLAPKSVTAGVAMGISESLHADPSLTAVSVVLTGIMGAIIVTPLMNRTGITDFRARGFAVGLAAHGIGTARAFQVDAVAGVFAGIAMSLNALVTSLLVPLAVTLLIR